MTRKILLGGVLSGIDMFMWEGVRPLTRTTENQMLRRRLTHS
jgi:hypothetical protein